MASDYDPDGTDEARRERVYDDPTAFPLHMLDGILNWMINLPAPTGQAPWSEDVPLDDWHPVHLAESMLAGNGDAAIELMQRFEAQGGARWDAAVEEAMASIPDDVAAEDAADAARDAAEVAETHASLMPGRV